MIKPLILPAIKTINGGTVMKKSIISKSLLSLFIAAALFLAGPAAAMPGGKFGPKPQCPMKGFFYNFFGITEQQQQELEALQDETRLKVKPYMEQLRPLKDALTDTIFADTIDSARAEEIIADILALKEKILPIEMDAKVKAAQILTDEQRADMAAVRADITGFIDYILAYPELDALKDKYSERVMRAMLDANMQELNLTEEQKTAFIALRNATEEEIEPIADSLHALKDSFTDTLLAAAIDTAAAADLIDQMIAPSTQISAIHYSSQVDGAQILTPEQRKIIRLKINRHRSFNAKPPFAGK